jgi:hypothetical protein
MKHGDAPLPDHFGSLAGDRNISRTKKKGVPPEQALMGKLRKIAP